MAPFVDFAHLLGRRKDELTDLDRDEYLRFGNHVYVLRKEIDITKLLSELAAHGNEGAASPILHLHLYCHRLNGTLTAAGELELLLHQGGCKLRSLHIFAAELQPFSRLAVVGTERQASVQLYLYYEVESGPESFWVNSSDSSLAPIHVLRSQDACLDRDAPPCAGAQHFDLAATGAAGFRMQVSGANGVVSAIEPIHSVHLDELRPLRPSEFEAFGADARRLQNLPRLLDDLFSSAGAELMGLRPDISRVVTKLRFIERCARAAPNLVGLVTESETLFGRLELPKRFPKPAGTLPNDWFFVPETVPHALADAMHPEITNLINANRSLESHEEMQKLRALIRETSGAIIGTISASVASEVPQARLDATRDQAASRTVAVIDKMDDLRKYQRELEDAQNAFQTGINKYKATMKKKFLQSLGKVLFEVGATVGFAIYTGGAGAPLTVGALNKVLQGAETIEESSKLSVALKALGKALVTVSPKMYAAFTNHSKFSKVGTDQNKRSKAVASDLKATAGKITETMLSGKAGERIDYLGLLAEWREMDVCADNAFAALKAEIAPETIDDVDTYQVALKKLAVRGETLVNALRLAYEARTEYLLLEADKKARDAALGEIQNLHQGVLSGRTHEVIAFMSIKQCLSADLAQRRRVVFNMLHNGVLALLYLSNNVKLQKEKFALLSPALPATQLTNHWAQLKKATVEYKQAQGRELSVGAAEAFPIGWRDLLINDLEAPFQIPPALDELSDKHHMRIRAMHATFVGLTRTDGTTTDLDHLEYTIGLGPLMFDRVCPHETAPSTEATVVQYYMTRSSLSKQGRKNNFIDDRHDFARRALCCVGKVSFKKKTVAVWNLATITDVRLHVEYETLGFEE
ncbi:MAG: hypothetical protein M1833_003912 [Piccolia ochrophora]|nr:MAG: hypothetical protein M1833_003912 [Piccolia ochrophora]